MTKELEKAFLKALLPLVRIANSYDDNSLDDEARKFWGRNDEYENTTDPAKIILYTGRGGGTLLTLADCLEAREVYTDYCAENMFK